MRVSVTDLVGHPGQTRALGEDVPVERFGDDPWGPAEGAIVDPIALDLHLDAVVEGILVRGTLGFTLELPCARCLTSQRSHREVEVADLFVAPSSQRSEHQDPDGEGGEPHEEPDPGYELIDEGNAIDLTILVRDALLIDLPVQPLCREDCAGLCPTCGADRNDGDCGHRPGEEPDPRWAKLAELDLSDPAEPRH